MITNLTKEGFSERQPWRTWLLLSQHSHRGISSLMFCHIYIRTVYWHFIFIFSVLMVFTIIWFRRLYTDFSPFSLGFNARWTKWFWNRVFFAFVPFCSSNHFSTIDFLRGLWPVFFVLYLSHLSCVLHGLPISSLFWSCLWYFVKRSSNLWHLLLCNFIQPSATFSLLGRNMLLTNLFSDTLNPGSVR
jgi:hypothetical protein